MFFVRMTDRFMFGWGQAKGKTNVLVVACPTIEKAEQIEKAAHKRSEMRRIAITRKMPRNRPGILYSIKNFSELSGPWLA